jgi:membrane associated rhomboid family serine protease
MSWLSKLERRYGHWCIPNLISILVAGQIVVYAVELFVNQNITYYLSLSRSAILAGQVWRLVTFVFVPFSSGSIISFVIGTYFTWFIGSALEGAWGDFRFNLYILLGMLGAIAACFATGYADTYCLSLSLFLAFALLYPEQQVLLFFVLPIKVKYLGLFAAAIWILSFIVVSPWMKLNYLLCMAGFAAAFGPQLWRSLRAYWRRKKWQKRNRR